LWWNDLALLISASMEDLADPVTVITFTQNEVKLNKVIDWGTDGLAQVVFPPRRLRRRNRLRQRNLDVEVGTYAAHARGH
jgi:hypothetical protein